MQEQKTWEGLLLTEALHPTYYGMLVAEFKDLAHEEV
jgi:hypothetical protein